jgi:hypothetical protein
MTFVEIDGSINGSYYNWSALTPASPFNVNLHIHNPNPGNTTAGGKNFIKRDATGLNTSVDLWCQNFTTPPAVMPGAYSLNVTASTISNGPNIQNVSTSYAGAQDNSTGQPIPGNLYTGQFELAGDYCVIRSFLMFDTSSLPDEAIIDSAYVTLVILNDYSDTDFKVSLQTIKDPVPHTPLVSSDYWHGNFPVSATIGQENTTGYTNDDRFNITINASGIVDINLTGYTNWVVRSNQDIIIDSPGVGVNEWIGFCGPGYSTASYRPYLIINYTVPSSNWKHFVNITFYHNKTGVWVPYATEYVNVNGTVTVPAPQFNGTGKYWWNVSYNSNHTNYGNTSYWSFETVNITGVGGGSTFITSGRYTSFFIIGIVLGVSSSMILWGRRRRKKTGVEQETINSDDNV